MALQVCALRGQPASIDKHTRCASLSAPPSSSSRPRALHKESSACISACRLPGSPTKTKPLFAIVSHPPRHKSQVRCDTMYNLLLFPLPSPLRAMLPSCGASPPDLAFADVLLLLSCTPPYPIVPRLLYSASPQNISNWPSFSRPVSSWFDPRNPSPASTRLLAWAPNKCALRLTANRPPISLHPL